MVKKSEILFTPLQLPFCTTNYETLLKAYKEVSTYDAYRNCRHIGLRTHRGLNREGCFDKSHLAWTQTALHNFPGIISYIENHIAPWMKPLGRISIICTEPGASNPPHIDCSRESFSELQLKFRLVLHGKTEDLCFITSQKTIKAPEIKSPFLMSGEWPHYMKNTSNKFKFTLAIGAPWNGQDEPRFNHLLKLAENEVHLLKKDSLELPKNYDQLFFDY